MRLRIKDEKRKNTNLQYLHAQAARTSCLSIPLGDLNANTIEPFLTWIFKLMEAYGHKSSTDDIV